MEKSVLASLMINENYADVEGKLTGKNFYAERHEIIFDAITCLTTKNSRMTLLWSWMN